MWKTETVTFWGKYPSRTAPSVSFLGPNSDNKLVQYVAHCIMGSDKLIFHCPSTFLRGRHTYSVEAWYEPAERERVANYMQVSSGGFPSTLAVAPPTRWQQVGKPYCWRLLSLPYSSPSVCPHMIPSVNPQTLMFKQSPQQKKVVPLLRDGDALYG